jgi:tetratricopeptide (TPR) repeat protein
MDNKTSEIAKLTERISRDPKSKLFVPLAEEYKKAGDIVMSIHVLTEGLKNNPGYVTARSFLGKLLIEKGDLPSAQKEFEEVVRAIPDNLMAQRKLADLYAIQDRLADAAVHYKIALTLNPKDTETATLLAKAEAGHDVKSLLSGIRPAGTPEPHKPHASAKPVSAAVPVSSQPVPEKQPSAEPQNVVGSAAPVVEEEVPEEVLVVEPLDSSQVSPPSASFEQPSPDTASSAPEIPDFLSEAQPESEPTAPALEQEGEDLFSLNEPAAEPVEKSPESSAAEEGLPVIIEEAPATGAGQEESPAPSGLFEEEQPAEEQPVGSGKQADDFTTDTLAELYISQGFFEKAVDIYERMLVDNPSSQGLKDKLAKVRAMAAASPAGGDEPEIIEAELVEEQIAGGLEPDRAETPALDAGQPAAAEQEHPRLDEWEQPATKAAASPEQESLPAQAGGRPKQFDAGFEPREYIPPDAVRVSEQAAGDTGQGAENPFSEQAEPVPPSPKLTPAGKKETVDRLEKWLKNIRKEN